MGTWEQRKLKEVLSFLKDGTHETHADTVEGPLLLSAKNIKDGTIRWDESDRRISQDEYEKIHSKFSLKEGDVLLTIVGSIGETAILKNSEGITFQRSVAFLRPNEDISSDFLYAEIQTPAFQKDLESRKSTSAQPGIYLGDLAEIPVKYAPSLEEQIKIGEYFGQLDNLITLHHRKSNIFIREWDFVWEQRKLDDVAEFSKGSGYSKGDLIESGTPIILYGRLYTKYETIISDVDTFVEAKDGSVYSKGGEVIVPASGETAEDIARAASVDKSGILLGGDLNVVMPNEDINSAFLAISISNGSLQRELARKAQGKSVVHIHNEEIRNLIVPFPTKAEQNKMENYFAALDHFITLHHRKQICVQMG